MVKRKRIALIFSYNENWIGGSYYILNLIYALNTLNDKLKPELVILTDKDDFKKVVETNYPYLIYRPLAPAFNLPAKIINKFSMLIMRRNFIEKRVLNSDFDIIFPASHEYIFDLIPDSKKLFWITDFQSYYFPHLFTSSRLDRIKHLEKELIIKNNNIVFSSNDCKNDFFKFHPEATNTTYVLPFAVTHPDYQYLNIDMLKEKYKIDKPYFFSPNQFWKHKNHIIILKALVLLKDKNFPFCIVFSGKENDYRNPDYFIELKKFVSENNIEDKVKFLGFIDRIDQLKLMKEAVAVIQPSLFEGWSTVVEDSKAMNQNILLSDIKVHKEQMTGNAIFFNPLDEFDLSEKLRSYISKSTTLDYTKNIENFAGEFLNIVNQLTSDQFD